MRNRSTPDASAAGESCVAPNDTITTAAAYAVTVNREALRCYAQRFRNHLAIPPALLWENLFSSTQQGTTSVLEPDKNTAQSDKNTPQPDKNTAQSDKNTAQSDKNTAQKNYRRGSRLPFLAALKEYETPAVLDPNWYLYTENGKHRCTTRALLAYNADCLLLQLARHLAANVRADNTRADNILATPQLTIRDDFTYEATIIVPENPLQRLIVDSAHARRSYVSITTKRLNNVITAYMANESQTPRDILFYAPSTKNSKEKKKEPTCWMEAEKRMETERPLMIQAMLFLEKDLVDRTFTGKSPQEKIDAAILNIAKKETTHAVTEGSTQEKIDAGILDRQKKQPTHVSFSALLSHCKPSILALYPSFRDSDIAQCVEARNAALHQTPPKAFSGYQGLVGKRYTACWEYAQKLHEEKKKTAHKNREKRAP